MIYVNFSFAFTEDPSSDTHGNDLQGVMERTLTSELGSGTPYVMGKVGSDFGFFQYTADYMPAGKAYLLVSGSAPEFLGFDENATGIPPLLSPEGEEGASPRGGLVGVWYTLSGTRLNAQPTQPGLYIHNGRKVVMSDPCWQPRTNSNATGRDQRRIPGVVTSQRACPSVRSDNPSKGLLHTTRSRPFFFCQKVRKKYLNYLHNSDFFRTFVG